MRSKGKNQRYSSKAVALSPRFRSNQCPLETYRSRRQPDRMHGQEGCVRRPRGDLFFDRLSTKDVEHDSNYYIKSAAELRFTSESVCWLGAY